MKNMATMTAVPSRMDKVRAATLTWLEWKEAGKAPRTRDAALKVISAKVGIDLSAARASLARTMTGTAKEIDDRLSYVVWDIQENGGVMLDYTRRVDAIFADLLMQASDCIFR